MYLDINDWKQRVTITRKSEEYKQIHERKGEGKGIYIYNDWLQWVSRMTKYDGERGGRSGKRNEEKAKSRAAFAQKASAFKQ